MAAVTATIETTSSTTATRKVLSESSLEDVTHMVDPNGKLTFQPNKAAEEKENIVFSYYLIHSRYREAPDPAEVPTAVPQSEVTNYSQNGSWVVDHFSSEGA